MDTEIKCRIEGEFSGYAGGTIFRLTNGQAWQQSRHLYRYRYAYRPEARIFKADGKYMIEVSGMSEAVEVVQVQIVVEGTIVSDFNGFNQDMRFEFSNGQIWQQAEYKYNYHYAYRPQAIVVDGINGTELQVDGMSESVTVRRVR